MKAPKLSETKRIFFQDVFEALVAGGYDFTLDEGQTRLSIFFREAMISLHLNINGTWTRD